MSKGLLGSNMRNRVVTGQRGVKIVDFYDSQLYMGLAMSAIMECNGSVLGSGWCNGAVMGARNPRLSEWHRTQHQCTILHFAHCSNVINHKLVQLLIWYNAGRGKKSLSHRL